MSFVREAKSKRGLGQEAAKLEQLQERKKNWDAVEGADKMLQIDREKKKKKADWKAKEQMSHFAVQEVGFLGI